MPDAIPIALCILIHLIPQNNLLEVVVMYIYGKETEEASLCNLSLASEWLSWNLDLGSKAYCAAC